MSTDGKSWDISDIQPNLVKNQTAPKNESLVNTEDTGEALPVSSIATNGMNGLNVGWS